MNALSNFVADAPNVVGFDPWARFVDYLEREAGEGKREEGRPREASSPVPLFPSPADAFAEAS